MGLSASPGRKPRAGRMGSRSRHGPQRRDVHRALQPRRAQPCPTGTRTGIPAAAGAGRRAEHVSHTAGTSRRAGRMAPCPAAAGRGRAGRRRGRWSTWSAGRMPDGRVTARTRTRIRRSSAGGLTGLKADGDGATVSGKQARSGETYEFGTTSLSRNGRLLRSGGRLRMGAPHPPNEEETRCQLPEAPHSAPPSCPRSRAPAGGGPRLISSAGAPHDRVGRGQCPGWRHDHHQHRDLRRGRGRRRLHDLTIKGKGKVIIDPPGSADGITLTAATPARSEKLR